MFIPKVSESVFLFFILIIQTQRQDIRLYADRQKSIGWVGKLSLLMKRKRKLDHMTGCDISYSDFSPVSHSVYENFICCHFCKLSQQEKPCQNQTYNLYNTSQLFQPLSDKYSFYITSLDSFKIILLEWPAHNLNFFQI